MTEPNDRKQLARQAVSGLHWQLITLVCVVLGLGLGLLTGLWLMFHVDSGWMILAPVVGPFVGMYLGNRVALSLWANS